MKGLARTRITATLIALVLGLFTAQEAQAQAAVITGKVTNEQGAPIPGANVGITSLGVGAQANATGDYTFTVPAAQVDNRTVTVSARFIGFTPAQRAVVLRAGTQTVNFSLRADPFRLEEVVVTGQTGATTMKKTTFSIARVSEDQIKEVPASSPIAALAGKVSGARINIGRGNPGATPTIRLRGSTNLGVGGSTPLILIDGVVSTNAIGDIDANDIESIEVLKGAAAASFYGSFAANGVVNITTKRGRNLPDNKLAFTLRSELGTAGLQRYVPLSSHHVFQLNADGTIKIVSGARVLEVDNIQDNPYPATGPGRWRNQLKEWLNDGTFYSNNIQLGMRRGSTNFNSSFTVDRNQGLLPFTNGQHRQNARLNVDQGLGSKADLSISTTYGINKNDYNPGGALSWFSLMQMPGDVDLRNPSGTDAVEFFPLIPVINSPSARANPLYNLKHLEYDLRRERIIGSASLRYRPLEWLRFEGSYGTDRLNSREVSYQRRGSLGEQGQPILGNLNRSNTNNISDNMQLNATVTKNLMSVLSTTRFAYLYDQTRSSFLSAGGSKLNVGDVPDLGAVDPLQSSINSQEILTRAVNYMGSQAFDIRDRYLFDFLYRSDGSSQFGPANRRESFYRVSGAWRVSEDFRFPGVQEFKIRAAQGTAGLRPGFFNQYESYSVSGGQISKNQLGNKSLKPAVQTEKEFGINTTFGNRFDLELVRANRVTRGAFLPIPLSLAQSGGFSTQVQNAADIEAKTTELSLQTRVFDRPNFAYSFSLTGDNTSQKIVKLGRAPFRVSAEGLQGQEVFYYKEGEALGIIYGTRWIRTFAELKKDPANAAAIESDYVVNPLGYLVLKTAPAVPLRYTIVDAAGVTQNQHKIGDVNPDYSFGFANNLRFRSFNVYALFDGQRGGNVYNFTKQWMFQDQRHGDQDQFGKPDAEKVPLAFYEAGLFNGLVGSDYFVEDGSYVKLRELSVSYRLGNRAMQVAGLNRFASGIKLALIGRNLYTWTDYTGFDPEVTSGTDFNFRIDGFQYPNFRTISGQVEITF